MGGRPGFGSSIDLEHECPEQTNCMARQKRICLTGSASSSSSKSKRAKQKDAVASLPSDIVSRILLRLSSSFLYDSARFACKTWAEILRCPHFVNSHLFHSNTSAFLVETYAPDSRFPNILSVEIKDCWNVQVTDLNLSCRGHICNTSDGILLIRAKCAGGNSLYVANPVTKQVLKPPGCSNFDFFCYTAIARIPNTGELKIVALHIESNNLELFVMTLGDRMLWRKLSTPPVYNELPNCHRWFLSVDGVLYLSPTPSKDSDSIIAIDLRDESVHFILLPERNEFGNRKTIMCDRNNIYLMDTYCQPYSEDKGFLRLWLLKDWHRSEWVMLRTLSGFPPACPIAPLMWIEAEQVLIARTGRTGDVILGSEGRIQTCSSNHTMVACWFEAGKCKKIVKFCEFAPGIRVFWHTNSLLRF